jgi:hypothetical protein
MNEVRFRFMKNTLADKTRVSLLRLLALDLEDVEPNYHRWVDFSFPFEGNIKNSFCRCVRTFSINILIRHLKNTGLSE